MHAEPVEGPAERPLMVSTMEERVLGETERPISEIGLGTWQQRGNWERLPVPVEAPLVEKLYDDRLRAAIHW
jgi:hypothetical protein